MTFKFPAGAWRRGLAIVLALGLLSGSTPLTADSPDAGQAAPMPPEQLEAMVAPIALYPDPLLSEILVASTYPLEVVQAQQWLQQNPALQGQALTAAAAQQSWDPSVQALVLFPDVLTRLNSDITWTTDLGNAFLANQGSVMDAIQSMRQKAQQTGKLVSTPQEEITTTTDSGQPEIDIEPNDPDSLYVPDYNPVWIWGSPIGYYYPAWSYPAQPAPGVWFVWGPAFTMNLFYPSWGGWGGWGWKPGWHDHSVIVNHTFITRNHYNAVNVGTKSAWVHNPAHRGGVAYPNRTLDQHFSTPEAGRPAAAVARPAVSQVQRQFQQRAISSEIPTERVGNRTVMANAATSNRSAFGGTQFGSTARAYSTQGRASLSHAAIGGGNRPSAPRGGGGGGAARGSGGGGRR